MTVIIILFSSQGLLRFVMAGDVPRHLIVAQIKYCRTPGSKVSNTDNKSWPTSKQQTLTLLHCVSQAAVRTAGVRGESAHFL
eukprot:TRINITY_DN1931_c0_g1_i1.p2 TRINITY_DN1931_c0_g1~~TRINITY_DN1931_c0_g1_i1.p2  ORF type:complete len:82 (+),score=3.47 TRINITY_DN1931_c0_g1_i1:177-422(+)